MDRRTVAGTFCASLFASGGAAVIGATALPPQSPFFTAMMVVGVVGIVASLVGFAWLLFTRPQELPVSAPPRSSAREPKAIGSPDEKRVLERLEWARAKAMIARTGSDEDACRRALDELRAAFVGIATVYDVRCNLEGTGPSYKDLLEPFIGFADRIYPLLRDGHVEAARKAAIAWKWKQ